MNISRVGVDIAKSVFHVHGVDRHEQPQWRGKYSRAKWLEAICRRVPQGAIIGMEACASAHYWARELQARGYQVKLVAAQFVKPYVKTNKNDRADAEAICEALGRPTMRFVAVKSVEQQDCQATHRIREELIGQRTAKANQVRGLVGEYGVIAPTGIQQLRRALPHWLEDATNGLSDRFRRLLAALAEDLRYLDDRVAQLTADIGDHANTDPVAKRLMTLRGIGPITASALSGALGDGAIYQRGRDFAASLGLTPRQHSTGGRERLLGISKRGNSYLRKLLVHGARAVLRYAVTQEDGLSQWIKRLAVRKHRNVAIVALANKTARMAWAVTRHQVPYDPSLAAAA
ncbi:MAG: IS110 family transposase [Halomonadaceae bacterium]|uniref:IS110 family transposase n=1 Tax=Halomonas colorata TaxID=2742615 RepID=A0ABR9G3G7_9GAMM|nr:IS110 family transposase [Halomonas colorata]MBE0465418.1 IS110 family transposase [Halomonas colorata]